MKSSAARKAISCTRKRCAPLGELAAGMAHDFNNSLCAVLGFLELTLLDSALPANCRGYLESSRTCALDAAQTVQRVQDFARWRRNEKTVEVVDPNALVRQIVELTRHKWDCRAAARGTPIVVDVRTEATACVNGNRAELREVLTNLILNAVDAMPQGGSLVVRSWSTTSDVFLSVQDTGQGISEAVRQRLFEPFFTTKGERGNGLGLSVSFGIIQRHNGAITVQSEVNRGSVFTVHLPATADTCATAPSTPTEPTPSACRKSLHILIVEDEESIRRFLAVGLTQMGHQPRVTASGQEALAVFAEEPFDVVLTDLGLPDLNGEEVARQVVARFAANSRDSPHGLGRSSQIGSKAGRRRQTCPGETGYAQYAGDDASGTGLSPAALSATSHVSRAGCQETFDLLGQELGLFRAVVDRYAMISIAADK